MNPKRISVLAKLALLTATLIWGSTFVLMKDTVDVIPPSWLLFARFTIGWTLLSAIFRKKLKLLNKKYWLCGAVIGLCLFCAYFSQTNGITGTTPGKNAMLTAGYCVLVPFLLWIVSRKKPDIYNILAAFICIIGIGMVALSYEGETLTIVPGDAMTLLGAFFYAAHMVAVWVLARDKDPILITILQFFYSSVFCLIASLVTGAKLDVSAIPVQNIVMLLYLGLFGTTAALLLQNIGQKYVHPSAASIILSLESVFGVAFSLIFFPGEKKDPIIFVGFALVLIAVVISETKLDFLKKKKETAETTKE
ncbi:MAG: DMT family transporter [Ruminococcaceae bacterium]|nr:DMT family transporter [Oscillospiraceae bacterium]